MSKKVLILGGTGFIGTHLTQHLVQKGYDVTVYSRGIRKKGSENSTTIKWLNGDLVHEERFDEIIKDVEIIFHLISTTDASNKDIYADYYENVMPTIRLLNACIKRDNLKIVYLSSGGTVYGEPQYLPIDEKHPTNPISAYGIHKLSVEKCIEYFGHTYNLDYLILRVSNPYGLGQGEWRQQGIVSVILANLLKGQATEIWGDGSVIRDYIYIEDLIDACERIINYEGRYRIFNVAAGYGYSINQIIQIIQSILKKKIPVNYSMGRIQDVTVNILDNSLVKQELSWSTSIGLNEGIREMMKLEGIIS